MKSTAYTSIWRFGRSHRKFHRPFQPHISPSNVLTWWQQNFQPSFVAQHIPSSAEWCGLQNILPPYCDDESHLSRGHFKWAEITGPHDHAHSLRGQYHKTFFHPDELVKLMGTDGNIANNLAWPWDLSKMSSEGLKRTQWSIWSDWTYQGQSR